MKRAQAIWYTLAIYAMVIALWFVQGFYFILNDVDYGPAGIGIGVMMLLEAVIVIVAACFTYEHFDKIKWE